MQNDLGARNILLVRPGLYRCDGTAVAHVSCGRTAAGDSSMNNGERGSTGARAWLAMVLLALAFYSGVVNADTSPVPATLEVSAGAGQLGVLEQAFPLPLQARVLAADGTPVAGASVYFEADHCHNDGTACLTPTGYASFSGNSDAVAVTNADGIAVAPALTVGDQ